MLHQGQKVLKNVSRRGFGVLVEVPITPKETAPFGPLRRLFGLGAQRAREGKAQHVAQVDKVRGRSPLIGTKGAVPATCRSPKARVKMESKLPPFKETR